MADLRWEDLRLEEGFDPSDIPRVYPPIHHVTPDFMYGRATDGDSPMRVMVIVKADEDSEAGVMPSEQELAAMGKTPSGPCEDLQRRVWWGKWLTKLRPFKRFRPWAHPTSS